MSNDGKPEWATKDLNFAATMWCQEGFEIERLQETEDGKAFQFVFTHGLSDEDIKRIHFDYFNKKLRVEPKSFCENQDKLRDLLFPQMRALKERNRNGKKGR